LNDDPHVSPAPACKPERQCTAHSKRTGQRCQRPSMAGREVCYHHGGKTPRGPALPQFKTGRYSKLLPSRLASTYRRAARDPELLAMRQDIALVDARLGEVLGKIDTGESGGLWAALQSIWAKLARAERSGDAAAAVALKGQVGNLIAKGAADVEVWAEVAELLYLRRKLVDSERKRLVDAEQMVDKQQLLVFVGLLFEVVSKHVQDRKALGAIIADIGRLTGAGGADLPGGGEEESADGE
jgi:hypothetical protein